MSQLPYELWKIILEFKYENFKKEFILFLNIYQSVLVLGSLVAHLV